MKLLDRYIGVSVISSIFIVTTILLALFTFMGFFEELDDIGQGSYDAGKAIIYVLLSVPSMLYQLMPMATLLGCVVGLGALANNSELVVIRSAGVSLSRIAWSVIKVGILVAAVLIVVGEWVAPPSLETAQNLRANAKSSNLRMGKEEGLWAKDGFSLINARSLLPGNRLGEVSIYRLDQQYRLTELLQAEYAAYEGNQWVLHNVTTSSLSTEGVSTSERQRLPWDTSISPELINLVSVQPETLSVWGLYQYTQYLQNNGLNAGRFEQQLWSKFTTPLITMLMVLLAIPLVFGSMRNVSISQRVFVGVLIGVGFNILNRLTNYAGLVYELNIAFYMLAPIAAAAVFTYFLYKRVY